MTDLSALRARVAAGAGPGSLADVPAEVRRAIDVAADVGAPLVAEIDRAIVWQRATDELHAAVRVAAAPARAVAAALTVAPLALVPGLGRLLDVDLVGFYTTPMGRAVGLAAAAAHLLGVTWTRAIVRRVGAERGRSALAPLSVGLVAAWLWHPIVGILAAVAVARWRVAPGEAPEVEELVRLAAIGVRGGLGLPEALRRAVAARDPDAAGRVAGRLALRLELAVGPTVEPRPRTPAEPSAWDRVATVAATAARWGAPVAGALDGLAEDLRRETTTRRLEAAARVPALLTVPTSLLILPASLLAVAAPLVAEALATVGA